MTPNIKLVRESLQQDATTIVQNVQFTCTFDGSEVDRFAYCVVEIYLYPDDPASFGILSLSLCNPDLLQADFVADGDYYRETEYDLKQDGFLILESLLNEDPLEEEDYTGRPFAIALRNIQEYLMGWFQEDDFKNSFLAAMRDRYDYE